MTYQKRKNCKEKTIEHSTEVKPKNLKPIIQKFSWEFLFYFSLSFHVTMIAEILKLYVISEAVFL